MGMAYFKAYVTFYDGCRTVVKNKQKVCFFVLCHICPQSRSLCVPFVKPTVSRDAYAFLLRPQKKGVIPNSWFKKGR